MKYFIIALVIAAVLAITTHLLDFNNNKTDKLFLIIIGVLLIVSGLFFSIRGEVFKDTDSKVQSEKLSITKENTEDLKQKSDSILANINENLESLIAINDSVASLNHALSGVEKDLNEQLKIFKNTLDQTKIFEQKVSEQLELEKKRLALERPRLTVRIKFKTYNDPNNYRIGYEFLNRGKREAMQLSLSGIIVIGKNKIITEHFLLEPLGNDISVEASDARGMFVYSSIKFKKEDIESNFHDAVLKIKFTYYDTFLDKTFEEVKIFAWNGFNQSGFNFHIPNEDWKKTINDYIELNKIEF